MTIAEWLFFLIIFQETFNKWISSDFPLARLSINVFVGWDPFPRVIVRDDANKDPNPPSPKTGPKLGWMAVVGNFRGMLPGRKSPKSGKKSWKVRGDKRRDWQMFSAGRRSPTDPEAEANVESLVSDFFRYPGWILVSETREIVSALWIKREGW